MTMNMDAQQAWLQVLVHSSALATALLQRPSPKCRQLCAHVYANLSYWLALACHRCANQLPRVTPHAAAIPDLPHITMSA